MQSCFYAGSVWVSKLKCRTTLLFSSRKTPVVSHMFLKGSGGKFGSRHFFVKLIKAWSYWLLSQGNTWFAFPAVPVREGTVC